MNSGIMATSFIIILYEIYKTGQTLKKQPSPRKTGLYAVAIWRLQNPAFPIMREQPPVKVSVQPKKNLC